MSILCTSLIITLLVAALGCAPKYDVSRNTVEYFEQNEEARRAQMEECRNDPGRLWNSRDCVNARHADANKAMGSLRDLPPIGLVEKDDRLKQERQGSPSGEAH